MNNKKQDIKSKQGWFCSELVAALFQHLELLDTSKPASQYWPGNFSIDDAKNGVELINDAMLSDELIVELQ